METGEAAERARIKRLADFEMASQKRAELDALRQGRKQGRPTTAQANHAKQLQDEILRLEHGYLLVGGAEIQPHNHSFSAVELETGASDVLPVIMSTRPLPPIRVFPVTMPTTQWVVTALDQQKQKWRAKRPHPHPVSYTHLTLPTKRIV
eukprot:TRINITY_DN10071_c0_g2_i1.p1 TRINITY_DN10071_c0_g2~~TRINITY_DN10071_c0_g2_i1.p1  ORF type:complete len:150 (-),score=22.27 TRINITY_DN10071_c0_g2_i1:100-549(-)